VSAHVSKVLSTLRSAATEDGPSVPAAEQTSVSPVHPPQCCYGGRAGGTDGRTLEIEITRRKVLELYQGTHDYLLSKPTAYLEELQHRAEELQHSSSFSEQAAAKINHAACAIILEKRRAA
jgi:hypothetical protein